MQPLAIVLLSGGLDSATCLKIALADGYRPHALSLDYGQRHQHEMQAAQQLCQAMGCEQTVLKLPLSRQLRSSLTGYGEVPTQGVDPQIIPSTYVPARNLIFLSLALGIAESLQAEAIYLGINQLDYSGYPDCRPEFLQAFQKIAALATKCGVEGKTVVVKAPLLELNKAQIITLALSLNVPIHLTHSCYNPSATGKACGVCDSCRLRAKGFMEAGQVDPIAS